jgi:cardiolipin synthase
VVAAQAWQPLQSIALLVAGDAYFPAVFAAIADAEHEILIETYICTDDHVGQALQRSLIAAAARGVDVQLSLDAFGCGNLRAEFSKALIAAGVAVHWYQPPWSFLGARVSRLSRNHRKLVVVDRRILLIGGINFSAIHLLSCGPEAMQDYACRVEGPLAEDAAALMVATTAHHAVWPSQLKPWLRRRLHLEQPPETTAHDAPRQAHALLVLRDNALNRRSIEHQYRRAIEAAQHRVIIACAYFFPSRRLLKALQAAAKRGVQVQLILQGKPDYRFAQFLARSLYARLIRAGITIYEYQRRPLHAKVAVVDAAWATIGSSNLDPLSLSLNLEANLVLTDTQFNQILKAELLQLIANDCVAIQPQKLRQQIWPLQVLSWCVNALASRLARWVKLLPEAAAAKKIDPHQR